MPTNYNTPAGNVGFGSFIGPTSSSADFGILHSFYLIGGATEVPSIVDRNEIPMISNTPTIYAGFGTNADGGFSSGRRK